METGDHERSFCAVIPDNEPPYVSPQNALSPHFKLAARYDVIAERIDSAYIVLNEMQDALLEQAGESGHDSARLSELYAAQRRRLADILGAPTADAILRDLAIWASNPQR